MIGKSVYISNLDDFVIDDNVDLYFTSFHIAEEFNDEYKYKVKDLLCRLKDNNKIIICDISPRGLKQLNYSSLKDFILDTKIDILRFDFGYSMEESAKLAESTAILLNVSEFKDATEASEALISTMQAFQYTADESQHVVDILNEVGKLLPVDNYIG
jgi:hypothetical protein